MHKDATAYVKACDKCQRFAKLIRQLSEELTPMTAPMAFRVIGVEHHGSIPNKNSTTKILVVGIDYFTKWVEVEALATITEKNV